MVLSTGKKKTKQDQKGTQIKDLNDIYQAVRSFLLLLVGKIIKIIELKRINNQCHLRINFPLAPKDNHTHTLLAHSLASTLETIIRR